MVTFLTCLSDKWILLDQATTTIIIHAIMIREYLGLWVDGDISRSFLLCLKMTLAIKDITETFIKFVRDCLASGIEEPIIPGVMPIQSYYIIRKWLKKSLFSSLATNLNDSLADTLVPNLGRLLCWGLLCWGLLSDSPGATVVGGCCPHARSLP